MPNHVKTVLTIAELGETQLQDIHSAMLNDNGQVDFNVIVPMPDCLNDFNPNYGVISRARMALGLLEKPNQDPNDLGAYSANLAFSNAMQDATTPIEIEQIDAVCRAIQNFKDCGHIYWHDWSVEHWGTKWNAYGQPKDGYAAATTELTFQTAWSHPAQLIALVSSKFPDATFEVVFADEDTGSNCGAYKLIAGKTQEENVAPPYQLQTTEQHAEFTKLAFEVWHGDEDPKTHGYDENWQYSDEVYEANNP